MDLDAVEEEDDLWDAEGNDDDNKHLIETTEDGIPEIAITVDLTGLRSGRIMGQRHAKPN